MILIFDLIADVLNIIVLEVVRHLAATAEVEPVDAGAQMLAAGLDAVPGEHALADGSVAGLAQAPQRSNLSLCDKQRRSR